MSAPDIILDTQAFLWVLQAPERLSAAAEAAILDADALYVSAASIYEISDKYRLGKLPAVAPLILDGWKQVMDNAQVGVLPVTLDDAEYAGLYQLSPHRAPWDRIIAAQGVLRVFPVVSTDAKLDDFGVTRLW